MAKVKVVQKSTKKSRSHKRVYDFKGLDPRKVLTRAEKENFEERMSLTNYSVSADKMNFEEASKSVIAGMKKKYT